MVSTDQKTHRLGFTEAPETIVMALRVDTGAPLLIHNAGTEL